MDERNETGKMGSRGGGDEEGEGGKGQNVA